MASTMDERADVKTLRDDVSQDEHSSARRADEKVGVHGEDPLNLSLKLANPLIGYSMEQLAEMGRKFAEEKGMPELADEFAKGAMVAQNPKNFEELDCLSSTEKDELRRELTHKWQQPRTLYSTVILCSVAAVVQGMDQTVINGANLFFPAQFGLFPDNSSRDSWILGLVNAAPYLCCVTLGCWLTTPLNYYAGRRGAIFITCLIASLTCLWSGVTNSWPHLFVARFVLGLGIGPKSATVPSYAAECAPAPIRGALVMMWQMWTAFGIMLGYIADVAFYTVPDSGGITGLNWRLMLASAMVPPIICCAQVYYCPESPRWYMSKGRYRDAYGSMRRLRHSTIQATRDVFYANVLLEAENEIKTGRNRMVEMFTVPRNRRGAMGAFIVMFMQQFCGVNVIAYYSSVIFQRAGFSDISALLTSMGFGIINFLFALPAVWTIDTFGRRNLLLTTFPLMACFLLLTGFSFFITENTTRVALVALGIYLFGVVYSPGEGPVPFTYSAEAFPLYIRDLGMSFATATTWGFNFVLSLTYPSLERAFTPQGAFGYYAAWNIVGFFLVLFLLPETKGLTLEELDQVFSVSTRKHASYQRRQIGYFLNRYLFRRNVQKELLYDHEKAAAAALVPNSAQGREEAEKNV